MMAMKLTAFMFVCVELEGIKRGFEVPIPLENVKNFTGYSSENKVKLGSQCSSMRTEHAPSKFLYIAGSNR